MNKEGLLYHILVILSSVYKQKGFYFLAIMNNYAMNIYVQVFVGIIFFKYTL